MKSQFLQEAQETLSAVASSYNVPRMVGAVLLSFIATLLAFFSLPHASLLATTAGAFFTGLTLLYGIMMFASSYVEEEQQFWYWAANAWFAVVTLRKAANSPAQRKTIITIETLLLGLHRVATRWNQTGQKHAGAPDVSRTFFPAQTGVLWTLVLGTYVDVAAGIARTTLVGILPVGLAAVVGVWAVVPAIVFKTNFAYADAPELVGSSLGDAAKQAAAGYSLVTQAQVTFLVLAVMAVVAVGGHQALRYGVLATSMFPPPFYGFTDGS